MKAVADSKYDRAKNSGQITGFEGNDGRFRRFDRIGLK